ncbi:META domain-containing protein [Arthrobacter sp. SW1]|uniref:META domain-containing protein n=1 Tax=Arthrobacter sp. SW1 TaxID=1920889 RepID=UPI001495B4F1|nr:META domain-containing protein [Arthrobacter sp. SW1]
MGSKTDGPKPVCEGGPLGCRLYRSTGGRDATGELAWLKEVPLEVTTYFVNGTWNVGVKTPCNGMGVEIELEGTRWIPSEIAQTLMLCEGPRGERENWASDLFKAPVTWKLDGAKLTLKNSHGTVEFKDAGAAPHM